MKNLTLILTLIFGLLFINSCTNNSEDEKGSLTIKFSHLIDNNEIIFDSIIYVNEAGNRYEVNEIQYFISDLSLISNSGEKHNLINDQSIHYIDSDIPETMQWLASNDLPVTKYDSLVFTFGLSEANNTSFRFVNPPERDMVWPELLGGGYHYMKLNCKWLDPNSDRKNANFHLGIAKKSSTEFKHYYFKVTLPINLNAKADDSNTITLVMNVQNWFKNPNIWDWNVIGGGIMDNHDAIKMGCENGHDVFSIKAN
ncbi:MAG: hypothetical protein PHP31_01080 [Lentimicrobiaceae bacterium]|nr:hypothetical protein [Lentimicrobiaceae bacterium]